MHTLKGILEIAVPLILIGLLFAGINWLTAGPGSDG